MPLQLSQSLLHIFGITSKSLELDEGVPGDDPTFTFRTMGKYTIAIKNLLKRLINRTKAAPTKTPEHSLSAKQEESEKYLMMLNNMVCNIWTQYELTKDIDLPSCLNSKNDDGSLNVSYPGSCMYKIDWTGKTICEEFPNEDLDISAFKDLCVVAATIVQDITGNFSTYEEIWGVLNNHLENTWNKIKSDKVYNKDLATQC